MTKRFFAFFIILALLTMVGIVCAEQDETDDIVDSSADLSAADIAALEALDAVSDDDDAQPVVGLTYVEPDRSEYSVDSPALYTAHAKAKSSLFSERNIKSKTVTYNESGVTVDVLYVGSNWTICRYKNYIGYIKRERLSDVTPVDPVNTPPYGVQKSIYIATTATECHVRKSMSRTDDSFVVLNPGTMLSIWRIQDGWAIVPYWRTYGYIDMNELTDLVPVSPTDEPLSDVTPIAAYTSYYKMDQTQINLGRIVNIRVACKRLTRVMEPGESLNFNKQVGPYRKSLGYQEAWVLIDGKSVKGYGGGTCQVSSTLYNALKQLPGIEIIQRRPHGPGGAVYLPHGVDAAVGSDKLNLQFANRYDFKIRVEGHTSDDGALLMVIYKVD